MTRAIPVSILIAVLTLFVGSALAEFQLPPQSPIAEKTLLSETYSTDQVGNLEGRVFKRRSLSPLENAAVVLGSDTIWTDNHGVYLFQDILAGIYVVTASAFGFNAQTDTVEILSDTTVYLDFLLPQPLISLDVAGLPQGPPGSHIDYDFNISNPGDGDLIYNIEAIFTGTDPWFEVIPDSGMVPPLTSEQIILSIDIPDTAHIGYTYESDILIHNNSITDLIIFPFFVTVVEGYVNQNNLNPLQFRLCQNYPNPFNPTTEIRFDLPNATFVNISIFDLLGRNIATLFNQRTEAGSHSVTFDGSSLPSGIYFYRLETPQFINIKKMVLVK